MKNAMVKTPYICGPLTELSSEEQKSVKLFYKRIADACEKTIGVRGFVPHEHYDPIKHANYTPQDVDKAERHQVCDLTSLLIVVAVAPSWGGGIEVEMANQHGVPAVILCEKEKLENRKISRLLRGNPAVIDILTYTSKDEALKKLQLKLKEWLKERGSGY
ncbi:hypothetical protein HY031_00620 [Candidatus Gottesmanbacteria bacterium]|nr:hypothetical protein [Candidatus Gottesmanbacteria bacterium]